jgi:hypothetical protein
MAEGAEGGGTEAGTGGATAVVAVVAPVVTAGVTAAAPVEAVCWTSCCEVEMGTVRKEPTLIVPIGDVEAAAAWSSGLLRRAARLAGRCPAEEEERPAEALVSMAPAVAEAGEQQATAAWRQTTTAARFRVWDRLGVIPCKTKYVWGTGTTL